MIVLKQQPVINALKRFNLQQNLKLEKNYLMKNIKECVLETKFQKRINDIVGLIIWIKKYVIKEIPIFIYYHDIEEELYIEFEIVLTGESKFFKLNDQLSTTEISIKNLLTKNVLDLWLYTTLSLHYSNGYNKKNIDYLVFHCNELRTNIMNNKDEIRKIITAGTNNRETEITRIEEKICNFNDNLIKYYSLGEYQKIIDQFSSNKDDIRQMRIVIESLINLRKFSLAKKYINDCQDKFTEDYEQGILSYLEGKLLIAKNQYSEAVEILDKAEKIFGPDQVYWKNKVRVLTGRINVQLGLYFKCMDDLLAVLPFFEINDDRIECNLIYGGLSLVYDNLSTNIFFSRLFEGYLVKFSSLKERINKITILEENLPKTSKNLYDPPIFFYEDTTNFLSA